MRRSVHPTPNAVSLFANCGAGDVGFAAAGFCFGVMAELIENRLNVALCNHPRAHGIPGDLTMTWGKVVEQWQLHHGPAAPDLLAACPPCQGMSTARSDRGPESDPDAGSQDPRNLLVLPIAHIAEALTPTFVVVENVPAFLRRKVRDPSSGAPISAARLLVRLLSEKYDVYPFLSDLADFGVPQTRKRAFLTFTRRGSAPAEILRRRKLSPYPIPTHSPDYGGEPLSLGVALKNFDLAPLDSRNAECAADPTTPFHYVPTWPDRQRRMVAAIPPGSGSSAWANNDCIACRSAATDDDSAVCQVCGHMLLRPIVFERGRPRLVHGFRRASYRRMDPSRPAATITTASGRIGGSRTIHPYENRVLSPLECALLQTIPTTFNWGDAHKMGRMTELRCMIGEAVPPLFTKRHGEVLGALLDGESELPPLIRRTDDRCVKAALAINICKPRTRVRLARSLP